MSEKDQTSEEIHGIVPQPPDTCPMIDDVLQVVGECNDRLRGYEKMDEEEMRDALWHIEYELAKIIGYRGNGMMQKIRDNAASIRLWGQEWKDAAKEYCTDPTAIPDAVKLEAQTV